MSHGISYDRSMIEVISTHRLPKDRRQTLRDYTGVKVTIAASLGRY